MNEVNHQRIKTNGIWMHIAEQGTGPLVLLLHGFPQSWYSWRHQITHLANQGYHVVAPDLRGYGDSDSPISPSSYSVLHIVGDLIGLLDYYGEQQVYICLCARIRIPNNFLPGSDRRAPSNFFFTFFGPTTKLLGSL